MARAIQRHLPKRDDLDVLELGCGYRATQLIALESTIIKCSTTNAIWWPTLVRAGVRPSHIQLRHHKFGLNLFAVATKQGANLHN